MLIFGLCESGISATNMPMGWFFLNLMIVFKLYPEDGWCTQLYSIKCTFLKVYPTVAQKQFLTKNLRVKMLVKLSPVIGFTSFQTFLFPCKFFGTRTSFFSADNFRRSNLISMLCRQSVVEWRVAREVSFLKNIT